MEETTGRNTDFRKAAGVLAWLAGVAGPLLGTVGAFSSRSSDAITIAVVIGYATFVVGTLLFFGLRGKAPGIVLLVFVAVAFFASMQFRDPPGALLLMSLMVLVAGVVALIGSSGSRSGGFGKRMMAKAQRMAEAAKQADAGDANETKG